MDISVRLSLKVQKSFSCGGARCLLFVLLWATLLQSTAKVEWASVFLRQSCVYVCVFVQLCVPSSHTDSARCFHSFLFSSLSTFFTLLERSSKLEMSKILLAEMEVSSLCKLGLHWWAYSVLGITSPCHKSDCIWVTLQELSPRFESGCPLCQS